MKRNINMKNGIANLFGQVSGLLKKRARLKAGVQILFLSCAGIAGNAALAQSDTSPFIDSIPVGSVWQNVTALSFMNIYDALRDMMEMEKATRLIERGTIEVAPLAFMRGRTLNDSFVILDEAQNTTVGQMKMFLTRLGFQSKAVVTGDITQIDLEYGKQSGLVHVRHILQETPGVCFVDLDGKDVVRHPLVRRIVAAFEAAGVKSDS